MNDSLRLLHFADLHLDTVFSWAPARVAAARRRAVRDALRRIVELAHEHQVDAVTCAGDLYDQHLWTADTASFLRATLGELTPIPVLLVPGASDPLGPQSLYANTRWTSNVHLFTAAGFTPHRFRDHRFVLWGAPLGEHSRAGVFAHAGPPPTPLDAVHVAVFNGIESGHEGAGHRFRASQVERHGFVHALSGGVHTPADEALVTYPGNPEPLDFGETPGRGPVLVEFTALGVLQRRERLPVASGELHDIAVDVEGAWSTDELLHRVREACRERSGVARITLSGTVSPDVSLEARELAAAARSAGVEFALVDVDGVRAGYDLDALAGEATVRGRFVQSVREAGLDAATERRVLTAGLRALDGRSGVVDG